MRYHQAMLVSCQIPWDEREQLMEDLFREEIRLTLRRGFRDLYIFGTAGEGYAVDSARFERIVRVFHEETQGEGVFPQVGAIGLSTAAVVERIGFAHRLGFRTFQISLPSWGALNDAETSRFFRDVCGAFPDSRFLHYNLGRAKRVLTAADYRRLADEVPNLAATKNTGLSPQQAAELIRATPELQHFLSEYLYPVGCLHGECSLLSSLAPALPLASRRLFELGRGGGRAELFRYYADFTAMMNELLAPMLRYTRIDGAYDKLLLRLGGFEMPMRLLSPYEALPESVYLECRALLEGRLSQWRG